MAKKDYIVDSGNVFEDLGHPRPAETLAKAELTRKIAATIARRRLTQATAADLLNIDPARGERSWHLAFEAPCAAIQNVRYDIVFDQTTSREQLHHDTVRTRLPNNLTS